MEKQVAWGILGTGSIAHTFAKAVGESKTGRLVAIGSRSQESADKFGDEFDVPHRHATYEELLSNPEVQAVYISTPHPQHAEWAIKTADAGKHILCEKPLTMNYPEAMAVVEAAVRNDVFLMEAFMYRCHPQTAKLVELIREGAIGQVRVIQADFSFHGGYNPESRLLNPELGGGGILDVGCYCASMARLIAGAHRAKTSLTRFRCRPWGTWAAPVSMNIPLPRCNSPAAFWRSCLPVCRSTAPARCAFMVAKAASLCPRRGSAARRMGKSRS
jgi:predicted dehydrogenase